MSDVLTPTPGSPAWEGRPIWVDLGSADTEASRAFYARLLGWQVDVNPDPRYGGYAVASIDGSPVAGIGPKMVAEAPSAWSLYIGTADVAALTAKVRAAGGTVVMEPMVVGDQGRMAVFQDPTGAFISAWQPIAMAGFVAGRPNAFTWAELSARGFERAAAFYRDVFGWLPNEYPMGEGQAPYVMFDRGGEMVAGGMEMPAVVPAAVPSHWRVYFSVADVDAAFRTAIEAGGSEMLPPSPFPGGRLAIVADPEGAQIGLHQVDRS